jgi:hypothetical protein
MGTMSPVGTLVSWLPRDGLLRAARLALGVALRAIIAAARRCRTGLSHVGGSNCRRQLPGNI